MGLKTFLTENRKAIIDRWLAQISNTYHADASKFLLKNTNRFSNPVGQTFVREIETIFDGLIDEADAEAVGNSLEQIDKIRAVQDFTASQAVAYVFFLKTAIREELEGSPSSRNLGVEMVSLESKIDGMALMAFDSYMRCREKLFEVRCNDIKRQASLFGGPDLARRKHRS